jgi:hypothetical protein
MSGNNGDTSSGNGSGKKDNRPELTPAEIIIIAAILALIAKLAAGG